MLVAETSLRVSVPYLLALLHFVYEALPLHGSQKRGATVRRGLPSNNTSGYHSVVSAHNATVGLSCSLVLKKPEIVFFADPRDPGSEVIVLKVHA